MEPRVTLGLATGRIDLLDHILGHNLRIPTSRKYRIPKIAQAPPDMPASSTPRIRGNIDVNCVSPNIENPKEASNDAIATYIF